MYLNNSYVCDGIFLSFAKKTWPVEASDWHQANCNHLTFSEVFLLPTILFRSEPPFTFNLFPNYKTKNPIHSRRGAFDPPQAPPHRTSTRRIARGTTFQYHSLKIHPDARRVRPDVPDAQSIAGSSSVGTYLNSDRAFLPNIWSRWETSRCIPTSR